MTLRIFFQILLIISSAIVVIKGLKLKNFSFLYLFFLPFLVFYKGEIQTLLFILLFGVSLSLIFFKPTMRYFVIFFSIFFLFLFIYRPQIGVDNYSIALQFINQQRGEHLTPFLKFIPRVLHNKLSLFYTISQSFQEYFSLLAIFIQGKYSQFIPDYLLGYLFPYDVIILVLAVRKSIIKKIKKPINYPAIFALFLCLFSIAFFQNPEIKYIFSLAITYSLAVYIVRFVSILSPRIRYVLITFNFIFLIAHLILSRNFIAIS